MMKIFVISDLHLGHAVNKPMDVFGGNWVGGYWQRVQEDWKKKVTDDDAVLIGGDISWGMTLSEALPDLLEIDALPGKKFIIRGNHDYWWASMAKMNLLPLKTITFVQNNAHKAGDFIICGTRAWTVPENLAQQTAEDKKIFDRELIRLEMSLKEASKLRTDNEKIVCMTHYPPFNSRFENSPFTDMMEKYDVDAAIYGHLHGSSSRYAAVVTKGEIKFYLTSCDYLNNELLELY